MAYNDDVIQALARLRNGWDGENRVEAIEAFNTLDNAGVFQEIDEQTEYESPKEILDAAELAALNEAAGGPLDPAEWGDTTRLDLARHHAQA